MKIVKDYTYKVKDANSESQQCGFCDKHATIFISSEYVHLFEISWQWFCKSCAAELQAYIKVLDKKLTKALKGQFSDGKIKVGNSYKGTIYG